jgi:ribonuclease J
MIATLIIHRGAHQIGGCVTEISSGPSRVFIDMGSDLPGRDGSGEPLRVDGLTEGDGSGSALFITHYHADHVGRIGEIMPDIPVYMGGTAKAILLNLAERIERAMIPIYEKINIFSALDAINIGGITVTPLMVDHSAFDSYMFVIEAGGKRILHTGDFRVHGPRGSKTFVMLRRYAKNIDYIVCEGTMLSRPSEIAKREYDLQREAHEIMSEKRHVFVVCSSTNIDRIGTFYHANPAGRLFVCDEYQKRQLDLITREHGTKSDFYDFRHVYSYAKNLDDLMEKKGFCMLVRCGNYFRSFLEKYREDSLVIYSMWPGYLEGEAKNQNLVDFLNPYPFKTLHTSGHATTSSLAKLYRTVNPKEGLIPIHSDSPEMFRSILPDGRIIFLEDGEILRL